MKISFKNHTDHLSISINIYRIAENIFESFIPRYKVTYKKLYPKKVSRMSLVYVSSISVSAFTESVLGRVDKFMDSQLGDPAPLLQEPPNYLQYVRTSRTL